MSESVDLGTARGKVEIEYDANGAAQKAKSDIEGLGAASKRSSSDVQGFNGSLDSMVPALTTISAGAATAGAGIIAAFGLMTNTAADFEFQLSSIQAVSGATADEMDLISEAALRIGADTSFSASEAALAMEELLKAGISVTDTLNGAADATVALAAAGGIPLAEAAAISAAAMNQFKLTAEDLPGVADLLAGAANASATGVSEMGAALSFVGPTAQSAGVAIEDVATMVALFANNGIDGMRAGTSLRSVISNLASPTSQAATAMEELGLITADGGNAFFDAEGNMKSMAEVTTLLRDAMGGLTAEQQLAYGETMFGREQLSALSAIVNTSAEDFNALATAVGSVSAADVAATRLDNVKGAIEEMSGAFETAQITVGQMFLPSIERTIVGVTGLINQFNSADESTQQMIASIGMTSGVVLAAAGSIGLMVAGLIRARSMLLAATGATQLFGIAAKGASVSTMISTAATAAWNAVLNMNPIVRIIGIIGLLIAALITLAGGWDELGAALRPIGEQMMAALQPLIAVIMEVGTTLGQVLGQALAAIVPLLTTLAQAIMPIIIAVFQAVLPIIGAVAQILAAVLAPVLGLLAPLFGVLVPIITLLVGALTPLIELLVGLLMPVIDLIVAGLNLLAEGLTWVAEQISAFFASSNGEVSQAQTVWDTFVGWLQEVWTGIVTFFQDTVTNITNFFTTMGEGITTAWNNVVLFFQTVGAAIAAPFIWLQEQITLIWAGIMVAVEPVVLWFQTWVVPLIQAAINLLIAIFMFWWNTAVMVWDGIVVAVTTAVTAISNFITTVFTAISGFISTVWNAIYSFISGVVQRVVGFITSVWGSIVGIVSGIFNNVMNTARTIFQNIYNFVSGIVTNVVNFIRNTWNGIISIVSGIFQNVYNAIKTPLDNAVNFVMGIKDRIVGFFSSAGSWLAQAGRNIIQGLINGIQNALGGLTNLLGSITNMIPANKGPEEVDKRLLTPNGQMIMGGLIKGIESQIPTLLRSLEGITTNIAATVVPDSNAISAFAQIPVDPALALQRAVANRDTSTTVVLDDDIHISSADMDRLATKVARALFDIRRADGHDAMMAVKQGGL